MTKITMLQSLAGADFSLAVGDATDRFSDKEAKRLIAAGIAEPYSAPASATAHEALKDDNAALTKRVDDLVKVVNDASATLAEVTELAEVRGAALDALTETVETVRAECAALSAKVAALEAVVPPTKAKG